MTPAALNLRLKHLESRISEIWNLLNEYEEELVDEDDPRKKHQHRRRVEELRRQKATYEGEFSELSVQLRNETNYQAEAISSQIKEIDSKIEFLLDDQYAIGQMLSSYFIREDELLLRPVAKQLDSSELTQVESGLRAVKNGQISEKDAQIILAEARNLITAIKSHGRLLSSDEGNVFDTIESPKIETKHALKLSIPIIPFILSYEGDLGIGSGANLRKLWQSWKA